MVSVVIPTHNRAADLYSCITSLLDQIGDDDELIVIDNCSTDRTLEIMRFQSGKENRAISRQEKCRSSCTCVVWEMIDTSCWNSI